MPTTAANGWFALMAPIGALVSLALVIGLTRPAAREYFSEP
jgi:hypothetical protein